MRESTSVEFDNNLAKSMPDFGLGYSKYENNLNQSLEINTTGHNDIVESESKIMKQLKHLLSKFKQNICNKKSLKES